MDAAQPKESKHIIMPPGWNVNSMLCFKRILNNYNYHGTWVDVILCDFRDFIGHFEAGGGQGWKSDAMCTGKSKDNEKDCQHLAACVQLAVQRFGDRFTEWHFTF